MYFKLEIMNVYMRDLNSINMQYAARKYQDIGCIFIHGKTKMNSVFFKVEISLRIMKQFQT